MESQHLLSNNQFFYITSQKTKLSPQFNKSQDLKRIEKIVQQCFVTFDFILKSKELSQEYKDKLFVVSRIDKFIDTLTRYEEANPISDEVNKQKIARSMLQHGFSYFQVRYKPTQFLSSKIEEIRRILQELDYLSESKAFEEEGLNLYRLRKKMLIPPIIEGSDTFWIATCINCFRYSSSGKTQDEAINNIRHEKYCSYNKTYLSGDIKTQTYIKLTPPKQNKSD